MLWDWRKKIWTNHRSLLDDAACVPCWSASIQIGISPIWWEGMFGVYAQGGCCLDANNREPVQFTSCNISFSRFHSKPGHLVNQLDSLILPHKLKTGARRKTLLGLFLIPLGSGMWITPLARPIPKFLNISQRCYHDGNRWWLTFQTCSTLTNNSFPRIQVCDIRELNPQCNMVIIWNSFKLAESWYHCRFYRIGTLHVKLQFTGGWLSCFRSSW